MGDTFKLPGDDKRLTILGRTGSGKSQAGTWHLSQRSFTKMPWMIIDPKRDDLLNAIGAREWDIAKGAPRKAGLYITHALRGKDDNTLNTFFHSAMDKGRIGIYADEAYSLPKDVNPFRRVLTQGRSKRVPVILLSQRPAWLDRFAFSEASAFQMFDLVDVRDRDTVRGFVRFNPHERLPAYHSHWYDVGSDTTLKLGPVPEAQEIVDTFRDRLGRNRAARWI